MEYAKIEGIQAYVGGFMGSSYTVDIDLITRQVCWRKWEAGEEKKTYQKTIRTTTAEKLVEELRSLNLLHWKAEYVNPDVLDGTQWSVDIIQEGRKIEKHGSNEFPNEWDSFCKLISRIAGKTFL